MVGSRKCWDDDYYCPECRTYDDERLRTDVLKATDELAASKLMELNKIYEYANKLGNGPDLRTEVVSLSNALCNLISYLKEVEHYGYRPNSTKEDPGT